jgi:hypothetical protein
MFEGYTDEEKVAYGELLKEIKKEKRFKKEKRKRNKVILFLLYSMCCQNLFYRF